MSTKSRQPETASPPVVAKGRTLGVVGAGVMGRTLIQGLLESGAISNAQVWAGAKTKATCEKAAADLGISVEVDYRARVPQAGMILVCVKPGQASKVLHDLKEAGLREATLLISIMAGMSTAQLESTLATANPL